MTNLNRYVKNPDFPYYISTFKEHSVLKKPILKALKKSKSQTINKKNEVLITNWYDPSNKIDEYLDILYEPLNKHMNEVFTKLKHSNYVYQSFWFTKYKKGGTFTPHQHQKASWVSIYYLKLPNGTPITNFENIFSNEIFVPEINEGDIITFPGFIWHYSPINTSTKTKISISFNVD